MLIIAHPFTFWLHCAWYSLQSSVLSYAQRQIASSDRHATLKVLLCSAFCGSTQTLVTIPSTDFEWRHCCQSESVELQLRRIPIHSKECSHIDHSRRDRSSMITLLRIPPTDLTMPAAAATTDAPSSSPSHLAPIKAGRLLAMRPAMACCKSLGY